MLGHYWGSKSASKGPVDITMWNVVLNNYWASKVKVSCTGPLPVTFKRQYYIIEQNNTLNLLLDKLYHELKMYSHTV